MKILTNIFASLFDSNERQIKKIQETVEKINALEPDITPLSADQVVQKTQSWQQHLRNLSPENHTNYLNEILPEAFALVREASKRTLNMRHFDVQLIAGISLHQGKIAEQKTGEGKTLTATAPLYLNSLTGKGVHLVTPNDYLSRHGAGWMGSLYNYLGLSVGVIMQERAFIYDPTYESAEFQDEYSRRLKEVSRQQAYKCDIVYGTNHEFGFDYLRDNMARRLSDMVQTNARGEWGVHNFAIVDEVDSILIDVARTPLIISTSSAQASARYQDAASIVKKISKGTDYEVDEKFRSATLTDLGIRRVETLLGISNLYEQDFEMVHLIEQSLSARALYEKDKDYVVKDGKVVIIDQFTGRLLPSNRFSQGLHQAIEAKEGVDIQQESRTMAEVSYQNYFRMYKKLAGMTGTAVTEAEEFYKIYNLDVVVIPTNKPLTRIDHNDLVYKTEAGKLKAVADEIAQRHKDGQPVLVGTTSVEKSELLHDFLKRKKIPHEILNAKNHEKEALIIAQAGKKGAVTISTNMAGRGVDIILGGDPPSPEEQSEIREFGGLHVIGTERHESRRIDNQLRGRAGRQGDSGSSRFYISLQDDLMRVFGGERVENIMNKFGMDDTMPMEAGIVSKAIENAQKKVEGFNFDRRKYVVEMDDVINVHRDVVYKLRRRILELGENDDTYAEWFLGKLSDYEPKKAVVANEDYEGDYLDGNENDAESEKATLGETSQMKDFGLKTEVSSFSRESVIAPLKIKDVWTTLEQKFGRDKWLQIVSQLSLPVIDTLWMEHLVDMDHLREGVNLRGYAQKDPKVEYKNEGHQRFEVLVGQVYATIAERLLKIQDFEEVSVTTSSTMPAKANINYTYGELETGVAEEAKLVGAGNAIKMNKTGHKIKIEKVKSGVSTVGRNDPCPCGSGKKFKKCHGISS